MQEREEAPDFPPCSVPFMLDYLLDVGPFLETGMGITALTYSELQAWQQAACVTLSPWELRTLRRLSITYCNQAAKSKDRDCLAPFSVEDIDDEKRDAVSRQFKRFMAGQSVLRDERKK